MGRAVAIDVTIKPGIPLRNTEVDNGRHAVSRANSTRRVSLGSDESESVYLARIAVLEAELEALTAELARYKALALAGGNARLATDPAPGSPDLGARQPVPPSHVTADGTQGMRRGVSGRRTAASKDVDDR